MGWTYPYTTNSRQEVVDHILRDHNEPGSFEIIDHSQRGNVLYVVYKNVKKQYRFIAVYLLRGPSPRDRLDGDSSWGYKDMDESMGPYNYDCPERLLKQSDATDESSVKWREACREKRREAARCKKRAASLERGTILQLAAGWSSDGQQLTRPVTFISEHSATYFIGADKNGKFWRYRWSYVVFDADRKEAV